MILYSNLFPSFQYMCDGGGVERALSFAPNAHNVALGEASVYPRLTEATCHEKTSLSQRSAKVILLII